MLKTLLLTTAALALVVMVVIARYDRSHKDTLRYEVTASSLADISYDGGHSGEPARHALSKRLNVVLTGFSPECPMSLEAHIHGFAKGSISIRVCLNGKLLASESTTAGSPVVSLNFETDDHGRVWYPDCVNGHR